MIRSVGRRIWLAVFQSFDTLVIGSIKNLRHFVPTYAHQAWQSASSALSLDGQKQCCAWFFFPQNSKWWTEVHDSEVVKWQEHFPPAGVTASSHRRMKMATTKWANQPIKIIAGLLACRVLEICKLQSFLHITCRSNYRLLLPAVGGWTYAAGNLQLHVKGRRHPDGMCTDGASLCWWHCHSSGTRWHTGAAGERGTAVWGHYSASMLCGVHLGLILMNLEVSWPWSGLLCWESYGALAQGSCGEACEADEA